MLRRLIYISNRSTLLNAPSMMAARTLVEYRLLTITVLSDGCFSDAASRFFAQLCFRFCAPARTPHARPHCYDYDFGRHADADFADFCPMPAPRPAFLQQPPPFLCDQ